MDQAKSVEVVLFVHSGERHQCRRSDRKSLAVKFRRATDHVDNPMQTAAPSCGITITNKVRRLGPLSLTGLATTHSRGYAPIIT
jgi:hypothetical protein